MLRLVGVRGLLALAVAPACSTGALGAGAVLAQLVGVRWGLPAALGSVAIGVALAAVLGRLVGAGEPVPRTPTGDRVGIGAGVLLAAVPSLLATGSLDTPLQRWDAVFHLSALRLVAESGSASSLTLGSLSYGDGRASPYPAGWHALASLLPGAPTAVLTLGATVTAVLPWVLGCAALAVQLVRWYRPDTVATGVAGTAGVLAGVVSATPTGLWVGWGHVPNAAALAMVPGVLALALRVLRTPSERVPGGVGLAVALIGIGLAHPNGVLTWGALALPAVVAVVAAASRALLAAGRRLPAVALPVLVAAAACAVVAGLLASPLAAAVTGYTGGSPRSLGRAVLDVVTGQYVLWPSLAGGAVALAALLAAVVGGARGRWLGAAMLGVAWLLYLDAATGGGTGLSGMWYSSPARLSVVVGIVAVPLAATGGVALAEALRPRLGALGPALAAGLLVLLLTVPTVAQRVGRTASVYDLEPGHPPQFVTAGELAMIGELPDRLDGVVLGSPFSGASSAYGLAGVPVVFPVAGQVWSADQELVMTHLADVAAGTAAAEVCAAVERLGVRYLYQDAAPYQVDHRYSELDTVEVAGDVVAQADTARVVELPACGG